MPDAIFPYQAAGAAWLAERNRAGLHDEAGLGKTWTLIRAMDKLQARRGVWITRAMLRQEFMDEHAQRALLPRRLVKGLKPQDFVAWQRDRFDVLVLSYEKAASWARQFGALGEILDFVAIDEAHFLRNRLAARTKAICGLGADGAGGIVQWALHAWQATGTPMDRDLRDIYAFLRFAGACNMNFWEFSQRYYPKGEPAHQAELRDLIATVALRRTLKGVGIDLPPIFYTPFRIEGDSSAVEQYFSDHPGLDERILAALEAGGLKFIDAGHMMTIRRLCGEAKALPFAAYLKDALLSNEYDKVVVMGTHIGALETIHAKLQSAHIKGFLVNGSTGESERVLAKRAFQNDESVRYFIGNSASTGTGLTLHAACTIFVFESDWNPGANEQIIKRIRRIGQKRRQTARFVTLAGSFDEQINSIVIEKTRKIALVQGEELTTLPLIA